jgi:L-rhamnose isomerase
MKRDSIEKAFEDALGRYQELGVDVNGAMDALSRVSLSLPCWQGDDVGGFETPGAKLEGGGLAVIGRYPGKARNIDELRADLEVAYSLIPGRHRLNLHASYGDFRGERVDRDQIGQEHFASWVDWANEHALGIDFNATLFSHPMADSGFTLSNFDEGTRHFWISHVKRCREIATWVGRKVGVPCIHNLWIPDGSKDMTVRRFGHRELLIKSLSEIYEMKHPSENFKDSVESKLFGLGSESFVVGSYDFYLAWAVQNKIMLCLDMGHFHPTESVADKISSLLFFFPELMLHLSRGVRWDSDHVVIQNDELGHLSGEIVRAGALNRVNLALDFFDASINRVGAWVIGARATLKALLAALLEPTPVLMELEATGDHFSRLAMLEEIKTLPLGAIWEFYCHTMDIPGDKAWMEVVKDYEKRVLSKR